MENSNNIVFYCQEHAPVPKPYTGELQDLLGGYVKTAFPANVEGVRCEHMWVKVTAVGENRVIGKLDNIPAFTDVVKYGDTVTVNRDAIEDWLIKD